MKARSMEKDIETTETYAQRRRTTQEYQQKYGENTIVLFDLGEHYESYDQSAMLIEKACKDNKLAYHNEHYVYSISKREEDIIFPKIIREGNKIAILETK